MSEQIYGRLTVIEFVERKGTVYFDRVRCECGVEKVVRRGDLYSGRTTSCGCLRKALASERNVGRKTHGLSRHPLYHVYHTMIRRCEDPTLPAYRWYGGIGIKVCQRWRESFTAFLEDMGERPIGLELDRIDPDGDYEPGNARWLNRRLNLQNRKPRTPHYTSREVRVDGKTMPLAEAARLKGWSYQLAYGKMLKGELQEATCSI